MARRRSTIGDGSLDLLLDTICNTFGGIILIALMVVIMLTESSKSSSQTPASDQSKVEMIKNENVRQELVRKLAQLQKANKQFDESFDFDTEELKKIAHRIEVSRSQTTEKTIENSDLIGEQNRVQTDINDVVLQDATRKEELEKLKQAHERLKSKLAKTTEDAASEVTIRSVKTSFSDSRGFILKDGKLYGPIFNGSRTRTTHNKSDFNFIEEDGQIRVEVKPDAGEVVPDEFSSNAGIEKKFLEISPEQFEIRIFVFQDSFGRYAQVKKAIVKQGLKTQLHFSRPDDKIHLVSETGGRGSQ